MKGAVSSVSPEPERGNDATTVSERNVAPGKKWTIELKFESQLEED